MMPLFVRRSLVGFIAVMGLILVAGLSDDDSAEAGPPPPFADLQMWDGQFYGTNSQGLPANVFVNGDMAFVHMTTLIRLEAPCNEIIELAMDTLAIDLQEGDFSGSTEVGGGGGQLISIEIDVPGQGTVPAGFVDFPYVFGSVSAHNEDSSCVGGATFYAIRGGLLFGDVTCSANELFDARQIAGTQLESAINAIDALETLKFIAGIERESPGAPAGDEEETCPEPGEELPTGDLHGDTDCDGDIDAVDALNILKVVAGIDKPELPEPTPQPPELPIPPPGFCPGIGSFWFPYF